MTDITLGDAVLLYIAIVLILMLCTTHSPPRGGCHRPRDDRGAHQPPEESAP